MVVQLVFCSVVVGEHRLLYKHVHDGSASDFVAYLDDEKSEGARRLTQERVYFVESRSNNGITVTCFASDYQPISEDIMTELCTPFFDEVFRKFIERFEARARRGRGLTKLSLERIADHFCDELGELMFSHSRRITDHVAKEMEIFESLEAENLKVIYENKLLQSKIDKLVASERNLKEADAKREQLLEEQDSKHQEEMRLLLRFLEPVPVHLNMDEKCQFIQKELDAIEQQKTEWAEISVSETLMSTLEKRAQLLSTTLNEMELQQILGSAADLKEPEMEDDDEDEEELEEVSVEEEPESPPSPGLQSESPFGDFDDDFSIPSQPLADEFGGSFGDSDDDFSIPSQPLDDEFDGSFGDFDIPQSIPDPVPSGARSSVPQHGFEIQPPAGGVFQIQPPPAGGAQPILSPIPVRPIPPQPAGVHPPQHLPGGAPPPQPRPSGIHPPSGIPPPRPLPSGGHLPPRPSAAGPPPQPRPSAGPPQSRPSAGPPQSRLPATPSRPSASRSSSVSTMRSKSALSISPIDSGRKLSAVHIPKPDRKRSSSKKLAPQKLKDSKKKKKKRPKKKSPRRHERPSSSIEPTAALDDILAIGGGSSDAPTSSKSEESHPWPGNLADGLLDLPTQEVDDRVEAKEPQESSPKADIRITPSHEFEREPSVDDEEEKVPESNEAVLKRQEELVKQQDEHLDDILQGVKGLEDLGADMNTELDYQNELLGDLDVVTDRSAKALIKRLFRRDKKKKKKKTKIDDVFADMENVFNGLAALLIKFEPDWELYPPPNLAFKSILYCFYFFPLLFCTYLFISSFTVAVMLPACFVILVVRTGTIEKDVKKGFAVRQEVLAQETVEQKTLRFISLLLRALPMLFLTTGYPIIAIYHIIPTYGTSYQVVMSSIGAQICIILILQMLGTYRSLMSHRERKKEEHRELLSMSHDVRGKWIENSSFQWKNKGNWIALVTLVVEALQFVTFPSLSLSKSGETSEGGEGKSSFESAILPVLFLDFTSFMSHNIHFIYGYGAIAVVLLLVLTFLCQFIRELHKFGTLKLRKGNKEAANNTFFYSFVGSIVYGHGDLQDVSPKLSGLVAVISDTLFLVVCGKLLMVLACITEENDVPVMQLNPDVECWQGDHKLLATLSLIAFSYYLPLSSMIAPMLVESNDPNAKKKKDADIDQEKPEPHKDVGYVKPFLSLIVVAKCLMLVLAQFFGGGDPIYVTASTITVLGLLSVFTLMWVLRDTSAGVEPCKPATINIIRTLAFIGGVWGGICAMLAYKFFPEVLGGDVKFVLLFSGEILIFVGGIFWYKKIKWRQAMRRQEEMLQNDALELQVIKDNSGKMMYRQIDEDSILKCTREGGWYWG